MKSSIASVKLLMLHCMVTEEFSVPSYKNSYWKSLGSTNLAFIGVIQLEMCPFIKMYIFQYTLYGEVAVHTT